MDKVISFLLCIVLSSCTFLPGKKDSQISEEMLTIVHASSVESLSPYQDNVTAKQRLANVYEALVGFDQDFRIQPKIALSWGNIDNMTWEFRLRENVNFHNGQIVTAEDVVYSFTKAKESEALSGILAHINEVNGNDSKVIITTTVPDPTLLNKIQQVYIIPEGYFETEDFLKNKPIGTASYKYEDKSESTLTLTRFDNYWGKQPYFKNVNIRTMPGRNERKNQLLSEEIDILGAVPPQSMEELFQNQEIILHFFPSLTIYFLGINTNKKINGKKNPLQNLEIREAIWHILDRRLLVDEINDLIEASHQLISANIFGYNSEFVEAEKHIDTAKDFMKEQGHKNGFRIKLAVTEDLTKSALALKSNFEGLKIKTEVDFLDPEDFIESLGKDEAHMFIIGWKFDSGDPAVYLRNFFHSKTDDDSYGSYNYFNFSTDNLDKLIDEQEQEFDQEERLAKLHSIFEEIDTHKIALPLFEPKEVYASQSYINWEPRSDGIILAQEASRKSEEK